MILRTLFSDIYLVGGLGGLIVAILYAKDHKVKSFEDKIFLLFCISSIVWSAGFSVMTLQYTEETAHFWRSIGILGTLNYMITAQTLLCRISGIRKKRMRHFVGFVMAGYPIYFLALSPANTTYLQTNFGMTYHFNSGWVSIAYSTYYVLASVNIIAVILFMIFRAESKKAKAFGKRFLIVALLIVVGTVLDMIFPALGYPALPGSGVTQFWGLMVLNRAMISLTKNQLNVSNMSEYIFSSVKDSVLVLDAEGTIAFANDAAFEFIGLNRERDLGKTKLADVFETDARYDKDFLSYESVDGYVKTNKIHSVVSFSEIYDKYGDKIGYIAIIKDDTERIKYITELQKAREEADNSNKAKTTFLANMSHEIRTPMNSIIGFSEIILKQKLSTEEMLEYVGTIKESSYNLLGIINDVLDISKIESGKMEINPIRYELGVMLDGIVALTTPLAEKKGLEFRIDIDKSLPAVLEGDATKIGEIVTNLLSNAVKYTKEGYVSLCVRGDLNENRDKVALRIAVEDSGCGIAGDDKYAVFEAFEQVNKKLHAGVEGTGLGLAIVKGYTELMGGTIDLESEVGKGSVFTVIIDQTVLDATPVEERGKAKASSKSLIGELDFKGITVLAVDDNRVNLKVITKILEIYGFTVHVADGGVKAVEMCRENEYPLVLMDQMMPEMDGIEAMHLIRDISDYYRNTSKIVALTANAVSEAKEQLMNEGFDEYLKKPIEYNNLEAILTKFIG